jgi:hypothetical protein
VVPLKVTTRLPSATCPRGTKRSWTLAAPLQLDAGSRQTSRRILIPKRLVMMCAHRARPFEIANRGVVTVVLVKVALPEGFFGGGETERRMAADLASTSGRGGAPPPAAGSELSTAAWSSAEATTAPCDADDVSRTRPSDPQAQPRSRRRDLATWGWTAPPQGNAGLPHCPPRAPRRKSARLQSLRARPRHPSRHPSRSAPRVRVTAPLLARVLAI